MPPVDPPEWSVRVDAEQVFGGEGRDGFYRIPKFADADRRMRVFHHPVPGRGEVSSVLCPPGFVAHGVAGGCIYGVMDANGDLVPDAFQVLREDTLELVDSSPAGSRMRVVSDEHGCTVAPETLSGSAAKLARFDAVRQVITPFNVDTTALGGYSFLKFAGAGEGWLAFHGSKWLEGRDEIFSVEEGSHVRKATASTGDAWTSSFMAASGADTQFYLGTAHKVLAMDVNTGASLFIGDGVEGAIKEATSISARGDELWVKGYPDPQVSNRSEVQMWRKETDGSWQMAFRGRADRSDRSGSRYRGLLAVEGGCLVDGVGVVDFYAPALSRPVLEIPAGIRLKDGGGNQSVELKLDRPAADPVSVRVRHGAGTATPGDDYQPIDEVVTFSAGASSATLMVEIQEDRVPESNETIELIFSEPAGLVLPAVTRGSIVIEASGLELQPVRFFQADGQPVMSYLKLWMRDPEVTVGVGSVSSGGPDEVCLWENSSGRLLGTIPGIPTEKWYPPFPRFLSTPEAIDVYHEDGSEIVLSRVSRQNGAILSSGRFPKLAGRISDVVLLGGGRVLMNYDFGGYPGTRVNRLYEIGGPVEGRLFPVDLPHPPGRPPVFVSDGRHLIATWEGETNSHGVGAGCLIGAFDPATFAPLWQVTSLDFLSVSPRAIRGDLLLFSAEESVVAMDLTTREQVWRRRAENGMGAVGDTFWYGGGYDPAAYDLATGARIDHDEFLAEAPDAMNQIAVEGTGGILVRKQDVFEDSADTRGTWFHHVTSYRSRPAVQLLNQSAEQAHDGSFLSFRVMEVTDVPVRVRVGYFDRAEYGQLPQRIITPAVSLPSDGSAGTVPYRIRPTSGPPSPAVVAFSVEISTSGEPPLGGGVRLPLMSGVPVAPAHQATVISSAPVGGQSNANYAGMRLSDGKILAFTGAIQGTSQDTRQRVDVFDADTGELVGSIADPSPSQYRVFGINVAAQGDKLLVITRTAGGESGSAEIFSISSGARLAVLPYTKKLPDFGKVLASNPTYFAIATPGLDRGAPAGSQVEAYRWADYKRAFRKGGGKNSEFGSGMAFVGDTLFVSATGGWRKGGWSNPSAGKIQGFRIGGKGRVTVPAGTSGVLVADATDLVVANPVHLRLYDTATMQMKWEVPFARNLMDYMGPVDTGERVVTVHDLRDLTLLDREDGKVIGATRFFTDIDNAYYGNLHEVVHFRDSVFTLTDGTIRKWPVTAMGDFGTWRWLQGLSVAAVPPHEDRDGNGTGDFDDYVANRLDPARPFATASHDAGRVKLDSAVKPPPDVLVVVEAETRPGIWTAIGWRDGHAGWASRVHPPTDGPLWVDLPADSLALPRLRLRYRVSPSVGYGWGTEEWPPADRIEPESPVAPAGLAGAGNGLPGWLLAQLGIQENEPPIRAESGAAADSFSYLRPIGGSADFEVESSADLEFWMPAKDDEEIEMIIQAVDGERERVILRGKPDVSRRYFRVRY